RTPDKYLAIDCSVLIFDCGIEDTRNELSWLAIAIRGTDLPGRFEFFQNRLFKVIRQSVAVIIWSGKAGHLAGKWQGNQHAECRQDTFSDECHGQTQKSLGLGRSPFLLKSS